MSRPAVITTPFPSLQEVGERYGISKKRQKAILKVLDDVTPKRSSVRGKSIVSHHGNGSAAAPSPASPKGKKTTRAAAKG